MCLAHLVADLDATVVCRHCQKVCPARMQSCPNCLAELTVDSERAAEAMVGLLARGHRMARPAGTTPFAGRPNCTLLRTTGRSPLLYCGDSELMEASVQGLDHRAIPPLRCLDVDDSLLFTLDRYEAAEDALVAVGRDGAPLATYLRTPLRSDRDGDPMGFALHVRDETSAPVATLRPSRRRGGAYQLVETGGGVLAVCHTADVIQNGYVDDQWTLQVKAELPLQTLGAVGILLAAKVLLGRASPTPVTEAHEPWGVDDDEAPAWGEWPYRL
jgi:hypothetical protein